MKKNSVDKRKNKPLDKDTRAKYKALVRVCESSAEHFKYQVHCCQEEINQCRIVIEHYEFVIENIELPGKGVLKQDPKTKEALEDLRQRVEYAQAMIRKHKGVTAGSKDIIRLCKRLALVAERRLEKYKKLLLTRRVSDRSPRLLKKTL
ncbi:MAG: hypothetical protein KAX15_06105 [Candidatus Omnitrophica bacterium]|nr:hypothetical protein [Candidatus Omnitrophota bacterium]